MHGIQTLFSRFGPADWALAVVVTVMSVGMAYVRSPRAKSLIYNLPIPFSAALVATGRGVDVTHLLGMFGVWAFVWAVRAFHLGLGIPILAADLLAIALYAGFGLSMARVVPAAGTPAECVLFWTAVAALLAAGLLGLRIARRNEPSHRSQLPFYVKLPLVFLLVTMLVLLKHSLRGFMPSFPMVTVFAVYEARYSLHTLGRRFTFFMLGFAVMATILRLILPVGAAPPPVSFLLALGAGWAAYLPLCWWLDRRDGIAAGRQ